MFRDGEQVDQNLSLNGPLTVMNDSCEPHRIRELTRAAWAVAEVLGEEGTLGKILLGPVIASLPASAPAAARQWARPLTLTVGNTPVVLRRPRRARACG